MSLEGIAAATGCTCWRKFEFEYTDCWLLLAPVAFHLRNQRQRSAVGRLPFGNGRHVLNTRCRSTSATSLASRKCLAPPTTISAEKIEDLLMAGNYFDGCSGNDSVVELQSSSDLWECADPDGDGSTPLAEPSISASPTLAATSTLAAAKSRTAASACPSRPSGRWNGAWLAQCPAMPSPAATSDLSVIGDMLAFGAVKVGGPHRSLSLTNAQCIVDMLPGTSGPSALANRHQTNCTGCNPMGIGGLKTAWRPTPSPSHCNSVLRHTKNTEASPTAPCAIRASVASASTSASPIARPRTATCRCSMRTAGTTSSRTLRRPA